MSLPPCGTTTISRPSRVRPSRCSSPTRPITDPAVAMRAFEGRTELLQYFDELIAKRRTDPREDLISALLAAEDRGDFLSHQELLGMLLLLLVGGHETTVNLIANGLLALL